MGVRANADIPRDAVQARAFGAEGIGLCRTEHMFFGEEKLPHMRAMIMARRRKRTACGTEKTAAIAACRFRWRVPCDGRLPSHDPYARSAAARVPAATRRLDGRIASFRKPMRKRKKMIPRYRDYGAKALAIYKEISGLLFLPVESKSCMSLIQCSAIVDAVWESLTPKLPRCRPGGFSKQPST